MNNTDYETWLPKVEKAARSVSRDFPDVMFDDVTQAVWEGLLKKQGIGKMLDPEADLIESVLYFLARTYAWKERKQHLVVTAQYAYRTSDVTALLKTYFEPEKWYDATVPADAYSELGSAALEMSSDLSRAWDQLSQPHKVLIFCRFGLGEKVDAKKLSRAVARMAEIINTYQPKKKGTFTGSRHVITNAHAAYIIGSQDDGMLG